MYVRPNYHMFQPGDNIVSSKTHKSCVWVFQRDFTIFHTKTLRFIMRQICECVCVFLVYVVIGITFIIDWVPYDSWGGGVGFKAPPTRDVLITLILLVPGGLSDDKYLCNDAGDEIIHAYMRLISDKTPDIKP